jgi:hypothetical protein
MKVTIHRFYNSLPQGDVALIDLLVQKVLQFH